MTPIEYQERYLDLHGWPVRLSSYRLGDAYYCVADNVSPGAWLARASGATRQQAEQAALERAGQLLARTRKSTPRSPGPSSACRESG